MEKLERFQEAFNYLYGQGEFRNKTECAKRMNRSRENVSGAYYGREPFFNDKFLMSFCKEFPIINSEWLLNGTGKMLNKQEKPSEEIPAWADTFISILSKQVVVNEALNRQLKAELAEVRTLRAELQQAITAFRIIQHGKVAPYSPFIPEYQQAAEPNK